MIKKVAEFINWVLKISWETLLFLLTVIFEFIILLGAIVALFFLYQHYPIIFVEYLMKLEPVIYLVGMMIENLIRLIILFLILKIIIFFFTLNKKEDKNDKRRSQNRSPRNQKEI